jgi:copper chaperone CopZ
MTAAHAGVSTTLAISGMSCGHCVQHVESALAALPDVTAHVDLDTTTAEVHHSTAVSLDVVVAAIEDAGYTARARSTMTALAGVTHIEGRPATT